MATTVLMDELHIQVRIPVDMFPAHKAVLRRLLAGPTFRRQVVAGVRAALAGRPWSAAVRVRPVK